MMLWYVLACRSTKYLLTLYEMGKRDLLRLKLRVHTAQPSISGTTSMDYVEK